MCNHQLFLTTPRIWGDKHTESNWNLIYVAIVQLIRLRKKILFCSVLREKKRKYNGYATVSFWSPYCCIIRPWNLTVNTHALQSLSLVHLSLVWTFMLEYRGEMYSGNFCRLSLLSEGRVERGGGGRLRVSSCTREGREERETAAFKNGVFKGKWLIIWKKRGRDLKI